MMKSIMVILCFLLLLVAGCTQRRMNIAKTTGPAHLGYSFTNLTRGTNSDDLLVVMAFSGGGTRAAALSYGVMEHLARTRIHWNGSQRRLLDEVDMISSVSGGSFTAAYYALFGEKLFSEFETNFLKKNVTAALALRLAAPWNATRLVSPLFDRSDLAAEYYDNQVFQHATFQNLVNKGTRPYILINATDMSTGARFEFTQDQFDWINSDLNPFPIARAVAASAAFPIILSPITLKNYSIFDSNQIPVESATIRPNQTRRRLTRSFESRFYMDHAKRPYVHLLDGGLSDNLGVRGLLDTLVGENGLNSVKARLRLGNLKKVVLIVVNAENEPDTGWERRPVAPGWIEVMLATGNVLLQHYSRETLELFQESIERWSRELTPRNSNGGTNSPVNLMGPELEFYPIIVSFDNIPNDKERQHLRNLPTTFSLADEEVDHIRRAAGQLLENSEVFQKLIREIRSEYQPAAK